MSKKITYRYEPIGPVKVVPDFLPSPDELAFKEDTVKITISLSKESVEFFKRGAENIIPNIKNDTAFIGCLYTGA